MGIHKVKIAWFLVMVLCAGMVFTACSSGGGGGFAATGGVLELQEINDPGNSGVVAESGGGDAPIEYDVTDPEDQGVYLLGVAATARDNDVNLTRLTYEVFGTIDEADLDAMDFYLVYFGDNGTQETKQLLAPTPGGDDAILEGPVSTDADNRVIFEIDPSFLIEEDETANFGLFGEFNSPPDVGEFVLARLASGRAENNNGVNTTFDFPADDIVTGDGSNGSGVEIVGKLTVTEGAANDDNGGDECVADGANVTDAQFSMNVSAIGENINVTMVTLVLNGTIDSTAKITEASCAFGRDTNGDGVIDTDFGATTTFPAADRIRFTFAAQTVAVGTPQDWVAAIDLDPATIGGDTLTLSIDDNGDLDTDTGFCTAAGVITGLSVLAIDGDNDGTDNEGAQDIVTGGTSIVAGTLAGSDGATDVTADVCNDEQEVLVAHVQVISDQEDVNVTQIVFDGSTSTIDLAAGADIVNNGVQLWRDTDVSGTLDTGVDTLVGSTNFAAGIATFIGALGTAGDVTPTNFFLTVNLDGSASETEYIEVTVDPTDILGTGVSSGCAIIATGAGWTEEQVTIRACAVIVKGGDDAGSDDDVDADGFILNGDTNVMLLDFEVTASGGDIDITDVLATMTFTDGFVVADIQSLFIGVDTNLDGTFENNNLDNLDPAAAAETFSFNYTVPNGSTYSFIIYADMIDTAVGGGDIQLSIADAADVTTDNANDILSLGAPAPDGDSVTVSGYVDALVGGHNPATGYIHNDNTDAAGAALTDGQVVFGFTLQAYDEDANVTQIVVDEIGGESAADIADSIGSFYIYRDATQNSAFAQGAETLVGTGVFNGVDTDMAVSVNFTLDDAAGAVEFWIVYDMADFAGNAGHVFTPDLVVSGLDGSGAASGADYGDAGYFDPFGNYASNAMTQTIESYLSLELAADNPADSRCVMQGTGDFPVINFNLIVDNAGTVNAVTIEYTGINTRQNAFDTEMSNVDVWTSTTTGAFDPGGDDVLHSNYAFNDNNPDDVDLALGNRAPGTYEFWLSVDVDADAVVSNADLFNLDVLAAADLAGTDAVTATAVDGVLLDTMQGGSFMISGSFNEGAFNDNNQVNDHDIEFDDAVVTVDINSAFTFQIFSATNSENIDLETMTFDFSASSLALAAFEDVVSAVKVYRDTDGDGDLDALIGTTVPSSDVVTVDISGGAVQLAGNGGNRHFVVALELSGGGLGGDDLECELIGLTGSGAASGCEITEHASFAGLASDTTLNLIGVLDVSEPMGQPTQVKYDQPNQHVLSILLQARGSNDGMADTTGESITVDDLTFDTNNGNADEAADVTQWTAWMDGGDGLFDAGVDDDVFIGSYTIADDADLIITDAFTCVAGADTLVFIAADLNGNATPSANEWFTLEFVDETYLVSVGDITGATLTEYETAVNNTVQIVGRLVMTLGSANPLPDNIHNDSQDVSMLQVNLEAFGDDFNTDFLTATVASVGGVNADVLFMDLYEDVNGDGALDGGDTYLDSTTQIGDNVYTAGGSSTITDGASRNFIISFDFAGNGNAGDTWQVTITEALDAEATNATAVYTVDIEKPSAPYAGPNRLIVGRLEIFDAGEAANSSICNDNDDVKFMMQGVECNAYGEDIYVGNITFNETGSAGNPMTDVNVELWLDSNGSFSWEEGLDTLLDSGNFDASGEITLFADTTVTDGNVEVFFLVYQWVDDGPAGALDGETFIAALTNTANVEATGDFTNEAAFVEDSGVNLPFASGTQTIVNCPSFAIGPAMFDGDDDDDDDTFIQPDADATTGDAMAIPGAAVFQICITPDDSGDLTVNALDIDFSGTGLDDTDITDVDFIVDQNDPSTFDGAVDNVFIGDESNNDVPGADNGTLTMVFTGGYDVPAETTEYWWVVVEFAGTASPCENFQTYVGNETYFNFNELIISDGFSDFYGNNAVICAWDDAVAANGVAGLASPRGVVTGDFDNDGVDDVAFINGSSNPSQVRFYSGDGDGTFTAEINVDLNNPVSVSSPRGIVAADFDGDGNLDVAVANNSGNYVSVIWLDGNWGVNSNYNYQVNQGFAGAASGICAGDFDQDGDADFAVCLNTGTNDRVQAFRNNGGTGMGAFAGQTPYTFGTNNNVDKLATGDFNADGDLDLVVASSTTTTVYALAGNPAGIDFASLFSFDVDAGVDDIAVADVMNAFFPASRDGQDDILLVSSSIDTLYVNPTDNGAVAFTWPLDLADSYGLDAPLSIGLVDTCHDGWTDIVVGCGGTTDAIAVIDFEELAFGGGAVVETHATGDEPVDLAFANLDNNGAVDVVTANRAANTASSFLGNSSALQPGEFDYDTNQTNISFTATTNLYQGVACDFNRDGWMDVAAVDAGAPAVVVYLNDGSGSFNFALPSSAMNVTTSPRKLACGDVNNDGYPDIVVAGYAGAFTNDVYINLGDGSFNVAPNTSDTANNTDADGIAMGDFNHDGWLDFLTCNSGNSEIEWFFNDGDGTFTEGATSGEFTNQGFGIEDPKLADVNGDGYLDCLVAESGAYVEVFLYDSANDEFDYVSDVSLNIGNANSLTLGDFDNDGDIDAMVFDNWSSSEWEFVENDGTGSFTASTEIASTSSGSWGQGLASGDVNFDGALDILMGQDNYGLDVQLTDGDNTPFDNFGADDFNSGNAPDGSTLVADFNNDGLPDVFCVGYNNNEGVIFFMYIPQYD